MELFPARIALLIQVKTNKSKPKPPKAKVKFLFLLEALSDVIFQSQMKQKTSSNRKKVKNGQAKETFDTFTCACWKKNAGRTLVYLEHLQYTALHDTMQHNTAQHNTVQNWAYRGRLIWFVSSFDYASGAAKPEGALRDVNKPLPVLATQSLHAILFSNRWPQNKNQKPTGGGKFEAFLLNDLCSWQLHGKYPEPFKFEKRRRILEADCDLQNGGIPIHQFASLRSSTGMARKSWRLMDDLLYVLFQEKTKNDLLLHFNAK